jgi:hypothetical protein
MTRKNRKSRKSKIKDKANTSSNRSDA